MRILCMINNMRLPHTAIIFLLVICFSNSQAQESSHLRLGNFKSRRPIHFNLNDEIRFKPIGEKGYIRARILGFKEDTLIFRFFEYPISKIDKIDIREKAHLFSRTRTYGKQLIWVGPIYVMMASLNFGEFHLQTAFKGAVISGVGWMLTQLPKKYYVISIKRPARVII